MKKPKAIFFIVIGSLLVLTVFRYCLLESGNKKKELVMKEFLDQEIFLAGKVASEPDVKDTSVKLTIETKNSLKVLVTVPRYPEYNYGDVLEIKGVLQEPVVLEGFNYKNYLKAKGISAVIYYPEISFKGEGRTSVFSLILDFKEKLRQSVYSLMPSPQNRILGALILGDKNRMPDSINEKFNIAGIRHITAVSGLHIVILSSMLMFVFLGLGLHKRTAVLLSLLFILLFAALTGFQISSVRAVIMGSLFLAAPLFGRKSASIRSIIITSLVMLFFNPFLLFYSVGFQLSVLAALGIICLAPFAGRQLAFVPNGNFKIREVLASTLSAYFFTLPVLVYNFGQVSLAGPLVNILVLPVVPWIMVSGFVFALVGLILPVLGWILSFASYFLLSYLIFAVEIFSEPWLAQSFKDVHWVWLFISYLIIIPAGYWIYRKEKTYLRFLRY